MTLVLIAASLIFFLWILATVVGSVSQAVREAGQAPALQFDERDVLELVAEKRAALTALKESELDYETGKVGANEYEEVRAVAAAETIAVMKQLDEVREAFRYRKAIDRDLAALADSPVDDVSDRPRASGGKGLLVADDDWVDTPEMSAAAKERARRQASEASAKGAPAEAVVQAAKKLATEADRAETPAKTGGFCIACGLPLMAGARFCGECGHRVGTPLGDES